MTNDVEKKTVYSFLAKTTLLIARIGEYVSFISIIAISILKACGFYQSANLCYIFLVLLISYAFQHSIFHIIFKTLTDYLELFNLSDNNGNRK
jgi:hypothetical protein